MRGKAREGVKPRAERKRQHSVAPSTKLATWEERDTSCSFVCSRVYVAYSPCARRGEGYVLYVCIQETMNKKRGGERYKTKKKNKNGYPRVSSKPHLNPSIRAKSI